MPAGTAKRQVAHKVWIASLHAGKYVKQEGWNPNYVELGGKKISRVQFVATIVSKFVADDGNYAALTLDDGSDTIRVKGFGPDVMKIEESRVGDLVRFVGKVKEYDDEVYLSPEVIRKLKDPNWLVANKLELGEMPERVERGETKQESLGGEGVSKAEKQPEPEEKDAKADAKDTETGEPEPKQAESEKKSESSKEKTSESKDKSKSAGKGQGSKKEAEKEEKKKAELSGTKVLELIKKIDSGDGAETKKVIAELGVDQSAAKAKIAELLASGEVYEPKKGFLKLL